MPPATDAHRQNPVRWARCHTHPYADPVSPGAAFSRASSRPFRLGCSSAAPAARPHTPVSSRDCSAITRGPAVDVSGRLIHHGFRGRLSPRTKEAYFVFVRSVDVDEQTTRPSRTVDYSGASPGFIASNPLRPRLLLGSRSSVHFQGCQPLQGLASSDSPHALAGIYTLMLSTRQRAHGRDPGYPLFPRSTPRSTLVSISCWALQARARD